MVPAAGVTAAGKKAPTNGIGGSAFGEVEAE
jgi:hypothetical protein